MKQKQRFTCPECGDRFITNLWSELHECQSCGIVLYRATFGWVAADQVDQRYDPDNERYEIGGFTDVLKPFRGFHGGIRRSVLDRWLDSED